MSKKITAFNSANAALLRPQIEEALASLAEEYGVRIKIRGGSYSDGQCTFKLEVATIGETGEVATKEATDFKACAQLLGLKPDDLGRTFVSMGKTFAIAGYRSRASAKPIIAREVSSGKEYVFQLETVRKYLYPKAAP